MAAGGEALPLLPVQDQDQSQVQAQAQEGSPVAAASTEPSIALAPEAAGAEGPAEMPLDSDGNASPETTSEAARQAPPPPPAPAPDPEPVVDARITGLVFLPDDYFVEPRGLPLWAMRGQPTYFHQLDFLAEAAIPPQPNADPEAFAQVAADYVGQPLGMDALEALLKATVAAARAGGRPVVDVYLPEQDINSGVVQIVVMVSRLGEVRAEGNVYFNSELLENQVHLTPGAPIDEAQLSDDLDWLNRNPFRRVDVVYTPGKQPGTTDVVLRTDDRLPVRVLASVANNGVSETGKHLYTFGFTWGDVFGWDHQFDYRHIRSRTGKNYRGHVLSYTLPVWERDLLSFTAAYAKVSAQYEDGLFDVAGEGRQFSLRYQHELPRFDFLPDFGHQLGLGFDYKSASTDLEFGGAHVYDTEPEVIQGQISYTASLADDWGDTYFRVEAVGSPGGITKQNTTEVFSTARQNTSAEYGYVRGRLQRQFDLPQDFTFVAAGEMQYSAQRLLPSEQYGVGGIDTVRGYEQAASIGDRAYVLSLELAAPPFSVLDSLAGTDLKDSMQLFAFGDWGKTKTVDYVDGETSVQVLSSFGWGVRYEITPYVAAEMVHAFPRRTLRDGAYATSNEDDRLHFSITLGY